jgi:phosphopantothenoylcysteine decarboxylase / phosphopantothenate---cysteine ligase
MPSLFQGKRVVLAATGSIAVYKAVDLASKLTQAGAQVDVVMTQAAQRFVTPLTFQAVTGRAVYTDMWKTEQGGGLGTHIAHVGLGEGAALIISAPATAHTLARLAAGLADDLLTVTALAARCPLMVAPAMDGGMYTHPAVVANLATLAARGVVVVEPDEGRFASGLTGKGRLPDTPTLIGHIRRVLGRDGPLAGRRVVVTAGGTREALDPVRYLTNHSSGKQGYAVAQAAIDAGADVTLISAASGLPIPVGATLIPVASAADFHAAVTDALRSADVLVMAAAVADYRPATRAEQKIKKGNAAADLTLPLARTVDILLAVKDNPDRPTVVVGFAAESENLLANARAKLERKGLDLLVANDITAPDAGFAVDTNRVTLLTPDGGAQALELQSKDAVAGEIIARVAALLAGD